MLPNFNSKVQLFYSNTDENSSSFNAGKKSQQQSAATAAAAAQLSTDWDCAKVFNRLAVPSLYTHNHAYIKNLFFQFQKKKSVELKISSDEIVVLNVALQEKVDIKYKNFKNMKKRKISPSVFLYKKKKEEKENKIPLNYIRKLCPRDHKR